MEQALPAGWARQENALTRTVQRRTFPEALAFLLAVGKLAERADHHPEVDLRYNKLNLRLTTHSAGHHITAKDFSLADQINHLSDTDFAAPAEKIRELFAA